MRRRTRGTITARHAGRLAAFLALMVSMVASALPVSVASAQDTGLVDDSTYVLESGQTVTWSSPWEFDPEFSGPDEDIETVFVGTDLGTVMIMTLPPNLDVELIRDEVMEILFGGFDAAVTIDRGAYSDLSYSLDLLELEGLDFGTFVVFRAGTGSTPTFVTFFMAPVTVFADQFGDAQQSVQVDGANIFNGVGGEGLQDLLEEAVASGVEPPGDDASDDASGDDATDDASDDGGTGGSEDEGDDGDNAGGGKLGRGTDRGGDDDDGADAGDGAEDATDGAEDAADDAGGTEDASDDGSDGPSGSGLVDDNTFVSPTYGVETTWSSDWVLDPDRDPNVIENGDGGIDMVALRWTGEGPAFLTITYLSAGQATDVSPVMGLWTSDDFLADAISSPDGGLVMADMGDTVGAAVYLDFTSEDVPVVYYREVHFIEEQGAFVMLTFFTVPQLIEASVGDAQDGVEINGEPALAFYSTDEILAEFGG